MSPAVGNPARATSRAHQVNLAEGDKVFWGRSAELGALRSSIRSATHGEGSLVLIGGEPGIGKTRLAEQAADKARASGVRVLWGRCWEGEGSPSFWPWVQILRGYQQSTRKRVPGTPHPPDIRGVLDGFGVCLPETDSDAGRFCLFDAVFTVLMRAASSRPLLILIDDLHWADVGSLQLLQFAADNLGPTRLVFAGMYRDAELRFGAPLRDFLAVTSRHRWTRRLGLEGLSEPEIAQLIEGVTGARPTDRVVKLFRERTGGNPFFLTETVRLLGASPGLVDYETLMQLPDTVREAVARRLAILSPDTMHTLQHASVIGGDFDTDLLALQMGRSPTEIRRMLDPGRKAKIVMGSGDSPTRYRFAHALVRECLYDQVPVSDREHWHAQLAASLERQFATELDTPIDAIAYHSVMSGRAGDPLKAIAYSIRAGERAATAFAHEDAIKHYRRALDFLPTDQVTTAARCKLLLSLGDAQKYAGDRESSKESFLQAAALARGLGNAGYLARAAMGFHALCAQAPVDQKAVALLREALAAVGADDRSMQVQLLSTLVSALHWDADPVVPIELSAECMTLARCLGNPSSLALALEARTSVLMGRCEPVEIERVAREAISLSVREGNDALAFRCSMMRYMALLQSGDFSGGQAEFHRCTRLAKALRYPKYLWQVAVVQAGRAIVRGQLQLGQRLIEDAQRIGHGFDIPLADQYAAMQQISLSYLRGEIAVAEPALRIVVERYGDAALSHAALALCCVESGRGEDARDALEWFGWSELQGIGGVLILFSMAILAEAVSTARERTRSEVMYWLLSPHADEVVTLSWGAVLLGSVSHYLGLLAASLDQFDRAAAHFESALQMNTRMRAPLLVACTQRRYAETLVRCNRTGDQASARELLRAAMRTFEHLDITGHCEATKKTLAELTSRLSGSRVDAAPFPPSIEPSTTPANGALYIFRREAEVWTIAFEGEIVRMRDARGLAYLACLLRRPEEAVHVLELVQAVSGAAFDERGTESVGLRLGEILGNAGPVADERARSDYRSRLMNIEAELEEAAHCNDLGRIAHLRMERQTLTTELTRAYGLDGHPRLASSAVERARIGVRNRIASSLRTIRRASPALARHLETAIRTGTYCSYRPERQIQWCFERSHRADRVGTAEQPV